MSTELPHGWERVRFGELLVDAQNGCGARSGTGTPTVVLRLADVQTDGVVASDGLRRIGLSKAEVEKYSLNQGDLLAFRVNGSRDITGRVIRYSGPPGFVYCDHFIRFRVKTHAASPEFIATAFRAGDVRRQVESAMVSSAGQNTVSQGTFREVEIPLPPMNEQRRILAKLETLQARGRRARDALDTVPSQLGRLRQSILAAAFRGDLTKDWRAKHTDVEPAGEFLKRIRVGRRKKWEKGELAKMRAKGKAPSDDRWRDRYKEPEPIDAMRLPGLPQGWARVRALDVCSAIPNGSTPKPEDMSETGEVPFVKVYNLTFDGALDFTKNPTFISRETHEEVLRRSRSRPGDVLMNIVGPPLGKVSILPDSFPEWNFNQAIVAFHVDPEWLDNRFLAGYLVHESARWASRFSKATVGQHNIAVSDCREIALPLPPLDEQRHIASLVDAMLDRVRRLEALLDAEVSRASLLDRALLAKAFRGELVPQDPNDDHDEATSRVIGERAEERRALLRAYS